MQASRRGRLPAMMAASLLVALASPAQAYAQDPAPWIPPERCANPEDQRPCKDDDNRSLGPALIIAVIAGAALYAFTPRKPAATRLFTPPDYALPRGYGAVAVVSFPRAPASPEERERYMRFCKAYLTVLPDAVVTARADPDRAQMVTLWPRTDLREAQSLRTPPQGRKLDAACDDAVDNYAYEAAERWLARVPRRAGYTPGARGPVLVAWAPPASICDERAPMLIYDMSQLERRGAISDGFAIWKRDIEEQPELWRNGWNLTRWRLNLQALTDRYGEQIVSAV